MGKNKDKNKNKGEPNPSSVTNRDVLQRLNFLYQASVLLNGLSPLDSTLDNGNSPTSMVIPADKNTGTEAGEPPSRPSQARRKKQRRVVSFGELSRSYVETMKSVGQKTNVRMDPSVKRRICKCCSAPLVPGISATVRIKDSASHGHLIVYQCRTCQSERRIPAPPVPHLDPAANIDVTEAQPADVASSTIAAASLTSTRKRKKTGPRPRLPPHFARDVGHIVFRGNERLDGAPNLS